MHIYVTTQSFRRNLISLGLSLSPQKAVSRHPERNEVKSKDLLFSFYLLIFWSLQRKNRFFDSGCASTQNDGVTPLNDNNPLESYCKAKVLFLTNPAKDMGITQRKVSMPIEAKSAFRALVQRLFIERNIPEDRFLDCERKSCLNLKYPPSRPGSFIN
jgi:hypothetical protein